MRDAHHEPCRLDAPAICLHSKIQNLEAENVPLVLLLSFLACLAFGLISFGWEAVRGSAIRFLWSAKAKQGQCAAAGPLNCWPGGTRQHRADDTPAPRQSRGSTEPYPQVSVPQQFLQLAAEQPDHQAILSATGTAAEVHLGELRACACACAELLRPLLAELADETCLVALYMHGGPNLVAAILGTWLAHAAWAPLDRQAPPQRLRELLEQISPAALFCDDDGPFQQLTTPVLHARQLRWASDTGTQVKFVESLERVAQVIYTSGSTGTPKGVVFTHARLAHSTHFFAEQCGVGEGTRVLQKTSNVWSVFRHEVFPALCRKGTIVFGEPGKSSDPMHLADIIDWREVTVLVATPSVLQLLLDVGELSTLRHIVCMGEPLPWHLADKVLLKLPKASLTNFYGSTETENTTFSVRLTGLDAWRRAPTVPAGLPQPHVGVHLLRPGSLAVASGEGEICFSGMMSTGYWQRPDLTAATFIEHPELGPLYRTGDLGCWTHQQLVVRGRLDRQVKVRGCRVELGEVEAALQPFVGEVAATVAKGAQEHVQIVAFVCPADLDIEALQQDMEQRMVSQVMPSLFVALRQLPRLASGKVDLMSLEASAKRHLAEQAQETHASLDSLGILQHLTKAQLEEERWLHNQQAFWLLLVMMKHMMLIQGATVHGHRTTETDPGSLAGGVIAGACHARDMIAFTFLLGFTDSRREPLLGSRDAVALVAALVSTLVVNPAMSCLTTDQGWTVRLRYEWFLYAYVWSRLVLASLCKLHVGLWQAALLLGAACLVPDDLVWLQIPLSWRQWLIQRVDVLEWKNLRFELFFMPGCYLLSWHATSAGFLAWFRSAGARLISWARDVLAQSMDAQVAEGSLQMAVCLASFAFFLALSVLPALDYPHSFFYKAVYVEGEHDWWSVSHTVTWQYMTHPSLTSYLMLWSGELLLLTLPALAVAVGMAFVPWHFKTMGSTCFGTYVTHCPTSWLGSLHRYFDRPVVSRITSTSFDPRLNAAIVVLWNVVFCVAFAHTVGAGFQHMLVRLLRGLLPPQGSRKDAQERLNVDQV